MENKEIEIAIQQCFESIEKRTNLEFFYQWSIPKKLTKTPVEVTLAENSDGHHGGGKAGFSTKSQAGIHWICLFKKEMIAMAEHRYFNGDVNKAITNVCIHEILHILDRIKNGKETKTENEIIRLSIHYTNNPQLRIEI
ncbi:MAG: hypothetical protein AABX33_02150 [Nanoarchaeota archaeon]